jgi:hypothetical protein
LSGGDVGDEPLAASCRVDGGYHGPGDRFVAQQCGLDLAELDPEPVDLDLEVLPAQDSRFPSGR